jgi:hypothetical protein
VTLPDGQNRAPVGLRPTGASPPSLLFLSRDLNAEIDVVHMVRSNHLEHGLPTWHLLFSRDWHHPEILSLKVATFKAGKSSKARPAIRLNLGRSLTHTDSRLA